MNQSIIQQAYKDQLRQFYGSESQGNEAGTTDEGGRARAVLPQGNWPWAAYALPSLGQPEHRQELPQAVLEAYDFYEQQLAAKDLAKVYGVSLAVEQTPTWAIAVVTDGDDGWLEIYDVGGGLLAAGRTYLEHVLWAERDQVRAWTQTASLPPALEAQIDGLIDDSIDGEN